MTDSTAFTPSYTTGLFSTTFKPATNQAGQSVYDLQRQGVQAASEQELARRKEALQRQMANQGLSNSGIAQAQQRTQEANLAQATQQGLGTINQAELTAAQNSAENARARQAAAEQQAASIGSQQYIAGQQLSVQEQQLAQQAQQFADNLSFQKWATQAGFDQQAIARAWQSAESSKQIASTEKMSFATLALQKDLGYQQLNLQQQQLAQSATQFSDNLSFQKWATQGGWDQQSIQMAWQSAENAKAQTVQKDIVNLQLTAQQNISNAQLSLQERIANKQIDLQAQGLTLQAAQLYGYTNERGQHVAGSLEIAQQQLGLQSATIEDQRKELYGYYDTNTGKQVPGKMANLNAAQKLQADQLYGYTDPSTGQHVNGTLENQSLVTKIQQMATQTQYDTLHGYTDPATGQRVAGTAEMAAKTFGLQSTEVDLQSKELFGYTDKSGAYIPGKLQLMSAEDRRAADQLYGYIDPVTGLKVNGTLQLQADQVAIQKQGLTLQQAQTYGYTDSNGNHVMGTQELQKYQVDMQKSITLLNQEFQSKMLDKQAVISADQQVQAAKAQRYYTMGLNNETMSSIDLMSISVNDPLAYQSYLAGKEGKTQADIAKIVDLTNKYRAASIANADDTTLQTEITKMFASWGVEEANKTLDMGTSTSGSTAAMDFTSQLQGKVLTLNGNTVSTTGVTLPPGTYTITKQTGVTKQGKWDALKQNWLTETGDVTYAVDSQGKKTEVGWSPTSTSEAGSWWNNAANPLSEAFWSCPFGIKF